MKTNAQHVLGSVIIHFSPNDVILYDSKFNYHRNRAFRLYAKYESIVKSNYTLKLHLVLLLSSRRERKKLKME